MLLVLLLLQLLYLHLLLQLLYLHLLLRLLLSLFQVVNLARVHVGYVHFFGGPLWRQQ
jgi:hypothetical protein